MIYLKKFTLPDANREGLVFEFEKRRIFNNTYPIRLFSSKFLENIDFDNITIFYGNNGSGKTTLLNIISEKLKARRNSEIDKGRYFDNYVNLCSYELQDDKYYEIRMISSDDVFDYLLDVRAVNTKINRQKEIISKEYIETKYSRDKISFNDYEKLKNFCDSQSKTMSRYVRERLVNNNIVEESNGESALSIWEEGIRENAIYILDEPENSLSAENQLHLKKFIEDSARFYNCQFIISTHSPFLLGLESAKIYDLDANPVRVKAWNELESIKTYYNFFKDREDQFKN